MENGKAYSRISKENYEKAKEKGINLKTFYTRIVKLNWSIEEALEIEPRKKKPCAHNNLYESKHHKVKICVNCKKIIEMKIDEN
jgi:hypothetical protein